MQAKKDVYLPGWVLGLGVFLLLAAAGCVILSFRVSLYALIGTVLCLGLGIAAILCWKNQWLEIVSDQEFIYSTMFGRQSRHSFLEIRDLKLNTDSMSLILEDQKVHVEACAVVSDRFGELINKQFGEKSPYYI